MYYREDIIDGILCYKTKPDGKWIALSAKELTKRIGGLMEQIRNLCEEIRERDKTIEYLHNK